MYDQDFIPRKSTTASIVIQGVKKGENPDMVILWTILGYPPVGVAIPMWVKAGEKQPGILLRNDASNHALLCDYALALKHRIFSIERGNGPKYMNFTLINNSSGTGYMQQLAKVEKKVFLSCQKMIEQWRKNGINIQQLAKLNAEIETIVIEAYKTAVAE